MKKIIFLLLTVILNFSFLILNSFSQWQADMRLTNNSSGSYTSFNNAWSIAANGNTVHIVWVDERDGNREIYYKRSTNGGVTWGTDTRLTNNSSISWNPSIAVSGSDPNSAVHIVWYDFRDGTTEIYYKRSTDGGLNWGTDTRLTNSSGLSNYPSIAVSGTGAATFVHIVWYGNSDGNEEIYYKRSTDNGSTWETNIRLTNNTAISRFPSVAVSGSGPASVVNVTWMDNRDLNYEIYYKQSTNGGVTWSTDTRLTNNSFISEYPSIAVSGSKVHIVWEDNRDGNYEIYYKSSTDAGTNWGADTRLTSANGDSYKPNLSASNQNLHAVWYDVRDGNNEIYYKRSTNGGTNWEADTRLTTDTNYSWYTSVAVSNSIVHVVWYDNRDVNWEIYYKRNPSGNPTYLRNLNSEIPEEFKLWQNYPNPFNPVTKIKFSLPSNVKGETSNVKLIIYNILGKEIETLVNESLNPGTYEVIFDGNNLTSGIYFYQLKSDNYSLTKKLTLLK